MAAGGPRPSPSGTTPHTATHSLRDGACEETAVPSSTRDRNPEEPPSRDRSGSEHFHAARPETEPFPATAFPRKHCCHRGRCPEQDSHRPPNSLAPNRWARVPDCQALLRCARLFSVAAERGLRAPSPRYLCLAVSPTLSHRPRSPTPSWIRSLRRSWALQPPCRTHWPTLGHLQLEGRPGYRQATRTDRQRTRGAGERILLVLG